MLCIIKDQKCFMIQKPLSKNISMKLLFKPSRDIFREKDLEFYFWQNFKLFALPGPGWRTGKFLKTLRHKFHRKFNTDISLLTYMDKYLTVVLTLKLLSKKLYALLEKIYLHVEKKSLETKTTSNKKICSVLYTYFTLRSSRYGKPFSFWRQREKKIQNVLLRRDPPGPGDH